MVPGDQGVVTFAMEGGVGIVTLNRPQALNALNRSMFQELEKAFDRIATQPDVKVVILTGAGDRAFAAGADVKEMEGMSPAEARELATIAYRVQEKIAHLPKPTIAAINGYALGGGCELAMCCDLRIASSKARMGQPEINLGIIPGGGGTQRLTRLVGPARAKELVFTGRLLSAEEALRMGLVNQVVAPENLMEAAMDLARDLARKSGPALALAKAALNAGLDMGLSAGLRYEIECFAGCFATEDHLEGIRAFVEKREPQFRDR